jgi:hypothetical protein
MEEIVRRIANSGHPVTLLVLFPPLQTLAAVPRRALLDCGQTEEGRV